MPLPPLGKPLRIERLVGAQRIEREAAHRGVAAGKEALAGGQLADRDVEQLGAIDGARQHPALRSAMISTSGTSCENPTAAPTRAPAASTTPRPGRRR